MKKNLVMFLLMATNAAYSQIASPPIKIDEIAHCLNNGFFKSGFSSVFSSLISEKKERKYCFGYLYAQDSVNYLEDLSLGYYVFSDTENDRTSDLLFLVKRGSYLDPKTAEPKVDRGTFTIYLLWRHHETFEEQHELIKKSGRFRYNEYLNLYSVGNRIMFSPVTHTYSLQGKKYVLKGFRAYVFLPNSN